jgi:hypothetical protein
MTKEITMRITAFLLAVLCTLPLMAQQASPDDAVLVAALSHLRQQLHGAPPVDLDHREDLAQLPPAEALAVARQTIGGAPIGLHTFLEKNFGLVIAEELSKAYGQSGPAARMIEQKNADGFRVLPVEEYEESPRSYDWARLNQKYPELRYVVRVSWPAVDRLGTYAVVRYELIGRNRPATVTSKNPWQWGSFVKFEKQNDGSWEPTITAVGNIWN